MDSGETLSDQSKKPSSTSVETLPRQFENLVQQLTKGSKVQKYDAINDLRNTLNIKQARRARRNNGINRKLEDLEILVERGVPNEVLIDECAEFSRLLWEDGEYIGQRPETGRDLDAFGKLLETILRSLNEELSDKPSPQEREQKTKTVRRYVTELVDLCSDIKEAVKGSGVEEEVEEGRDAALELEAAIPLIANGDIDQYIKLFQEEGKTLRKLSERLKGLSGEQLKQSPEGASREHEARDVEVDADLPDMYQSQEWQELLQHPVVILCVGTEGSGKSALGWRLMELYKIMYNITPVALEIPPETQEVLPEWIETWNDVSASDISKLPDDSFILFDEAHHFFPSKGQGSALNTMIQQTITDRRHEDKTYCFTLPDEAAINPDIVADIDILYIKAPKKQHGKIRSGRRTLFKEWINKAREEFSKLDSGEIKNYVYAAPMKMAIEHEGLVENDLPTFWDEDKISKIQVYRKKHGML